MSGCDDPSLDSLDILKEWFQSEKSGRWLIVYDNVDDVDLFYCHEAGRLASYFPRSERGSIVITSRNKQIGIKFATHKNVVTLPAMNDEESNIFLSARLGENILETQKRTNLSRALEGNPLALVQAVSFISENESTVARYLELYNSSEANKIALLGKDFEDDTRHSDIKNPIAATWTVTFEYLKVNRPLAAGILCLVSMFDTQAIPETLMQPVKGDDPKDSLAFEEALGILQAYSMVTLRHASATGHENLGRFFDLHRLVGLVTRNWLKMNAQYSLWAAEAVDIMSAQFHEFGMIYDLESQSRYLPHIFALFSSCSLPLLTHALKFPSSLMSQLLHDLHSQKGVVCSTCTAQLLQDLATYHFENGQSEEGLRVSRKATALYGIALGPNHRKTLAALFNEIICLWEIDRPRAESALRELVTRYTLIFGENAFQTRTLKRTLALWLQRTGKHLEAESLLRQLLIAPEPHNRKEQDNKVFVMHTLSRVLVKQGRNDEARNLCLNMSLLAKSPTALLELAENHLLLKEYSEAESILLRLLNEVRDVTDAYLELDLVYETLGRLYTDQNSYEKAGDIQMRRYITCIERYAKAHFATVCAMTDLFYNYYERGRYDLIEDILTPFFHDRRQRLGEGHPASLAFKRCLGFSRLLQRRSEEVSKDALDAVRLAMKSSGDQSVDLRRVGWNLGGEKVQLEADGEEDSDVLISAKESKDELYITDDVLTISKMTLLTLISNIREAHQTSSESFPPD